MEFPFRYRAVAFLDVLGFGAKLKEFEKQALEQFTDEDEEDVTLVSEDANHFVETILAAVKKLESKFSYYLFSDNICITSKGTTSISDLEELLLVISELYFDLVQRGYFLRGGIDYGLFIDDNQVAVGMPLANAYFLESKKAEFPRILLSDNLVKEFQFYPEEGEVEFGTDISHYLVNQSCELNYLNVFLHVFQSDDRLEKEMFFETLSENIKANMSANENQEKIYLKYKWLAQEFNTFVDTYTTNLSYLDENFDPGEEGFIEYVTSKRITHAN